MTREKTESWAEDTALSLLRIDAALSDEKLKEVPKDIWDDLVAVLDRLEQWMLYGEIYT